MKTAPRHRFRAMWPVEDQTMPPRRLLAEAEADLADVAFRHGVRVVAAAPGTIVEGRTVPGSGGAALVVLIECIVERLRDTRSGRGRVKDAARALIERGGAS